jgi:glycosyltransferase involved in cell wall biosynthesis
MSRETAEKTADVFFAGSVEGLPVRERGLRELAALRESGLRVDIPETRLSRREFYARCAQAWLTFSPEGLGWDCFRHYEAAALGSVPVINYPSILRHAPMAEGVHCFFYSPEPGGLTDVVLRALSDKERLKRMASEASALVMRAHTPKALCDHVLAALGVYAAKGPAAGSGLEAGEEELPGSHSRSETVMRQDSDLARA